jgi:hypothetical protein
MDSGKIRESYIRACQAFRNRPAMYAQVKVDLVAAKARGEITETDYKIVEQIHKSFNIIDTKTSIKV